MAFVTGTANSLADLLTAIQNACTANGWTLAGSVLYKGTCYIEVANASTNLTVRGGTGIDGSNKLTGATDAASGTLCVPANVGNTTSVPFTFPAAYDIHIHTAPDEVYVVVNYNASYYQIMGFGQSSMPGLVGTGNWYCGNGSGRSDPPSALGEGASSGWNGSRSLFCSTHQNFGVDHRLDSVTWAVEGAWRDWASLFWRQPNQWNGESIFIPIRVYAARPSGFISPVLECAHARQMNIANLNDQQVITLGSDKWKIYPWWARGTAWQTNGSGGTNTGVCGHAIRYDGT